MKVRDNNGCVLTSVADRCCWVMRNACGRGRRTRISLFRFLIACSFHWCPLRPGMWDPWSPGRKQDTPCPPVQLSGSVPVLVLVVPPVEVDVEGNDATRCHARNEGPARRRGANQRAARGQLREQEPRCVRMRTYGWAPAPKNNYLCDKPAQILWLFILCTGVMELIARQSACCKVKPLCV